MTLPEALSVRLSVPVIAAPMTAVSGPDLVIEACRNGVIGSFPTHNAASTEELGAWLHRISLELAADEPAAHQSAPTGPPSQRGSCCP